MYLLKKHLIKDELGQLKYMTMVRALSGIPQQDFMNKSINKLTQAAEERKMTKDDFKKLIDPKDKDRQTLDELKQVFKDAKHAKLTESDVVDIFYYVTGTRNPAGVKIETQKIVEYVYESLKAFLLE